MIPIKLQMAIAHLRSVLAQSVSFSSVVEGIADSANSRRERQLVEGGEDRHRHTDFWFPKRYERKNHLGKRYKDKG